MSQHKVHRERIYTDLILVDNQCDNIYWCDHELLDLDKSIVLAYEEARREFEFQAQLLRDHINKRKYL